MTDNINVQSDVVVVMQTIKADSLAPSGVFELADPAGVPAGYIEVTLKWKFTYLPQAESILTVEEPRFLPEEKPAKGSTDGTQDQLNMEKQKTDTQLKVLKEMTQDNGDRYLPRSEAAAVAKVRSVIHMQKLILTQQFLQCNRNLHENIKLI